MPTVIGPCHSDQARGQLGHALIFQQRGVKSFVKAYKAPKEPNSDAQKAVKAFTRLLTKLWPTLSTDDQNSWDQLATEQNQEPITAFFVENWKRHRQGQDVTNFWPPSPPVPKNITVTGGSP